MDHKCFPYLNFKYNIIIDIMQTLSDQNLYIAVNGNLASATTNKRAQFLFLTGSHPASVSNKPNP